MSILTTTQAEEVIRKLKSLNQPKEVEWVDGAGQCLFFTNDDERLIIRLSSKHNNSNIVIKKRNRNWFFEKFDIEVITIASYGKEGEGLILQFISDICSDIYNASIEANVKANIERVTQRHNNTFGNS